MLWEIAQRPAAHQKELADAVGVTPRTMTGLIDGLRATGFVVRTPDPEDRRAQRVELPSSMRSLDIAEDGGEHHVWVDEPRVFAAHLNRRLEAGAEDLGQDSQR